MIVSQDADSASPHALPQPPLMSSTEQDDTSSIASSLEAPHSPSSCHPTRVAAPHLTPCSWRDFLEQDFAPEDHVDLVSGFLVSRSEMPDPEHQDLITYLVYLLNTLVLCVTAHVTPATKVADYGDTASSSDRSPSSNSPQHKIPGKREPDIALGPRNEESSSSSASPEKKKIKFSNNKLPLAAIEITSPTTRQQDLHEKWASYAATGIPLYIILDRPCARLKNGTDETPTVIVGTLHPHPGWVLCTNGDPDRSPKKTRSHGKEASRPARCYYRKVYKGKDIVKCPYLQELGWEARQLLDKRYLRKKFEEVRARGEKAERDKRNAEERAEKAEEEVRRLRRKGQKS